MTEPSISVVVPCFNEADGVADTVRRLGEVLEGGAPYELIVVDDGSEDGSREILRKLESAGGAPAIRVIEHSWNRGYGAAIKEGIRRARGELVAITDADGTYPVERLPELVALAHSADMVVGARLGEGGGHSRLRGVPKTVLRLAASWLVGQRIPDMNSGLRVFRRSVAERFLRVLPDGFSLTTTLTIAMMRGGYDVRYVPIDYAPRVGRSKIRPVRDTLTFSQLILRCGMYFAPLRILLPLLILLSAAFLTSLGYDVFVLRDLTDKTVLLLLLTLNVALFALLADMIDKRA